MAAGTCVDLDQTSPAMGCHNSRLLSSPGTLIMQIPLQIIFHGVDKSDAIEAEIQKRASKLDEFYEHIMSCRITVEMAGRQQHQGKRYGVRVDITVPGEEIAVSHDHSHEDVYIAIRDALDAAKRRLQDYVRHQRGKVKVHEQALHGRVTKRFEEEGCGFIEATDGRELYFHRDNVVEPSFEAMRIGMDVQFLEAEAGEGLQAKRVSAGKHHYL